MLVLWHIQDTIISMQNKLVAKSNFVLLPGHKIVLAGNSLLYVILFQYKMVSTFGNEQII